MAMKGIKINVFEDFRGEQYVRETSHCGNTTIKRCYEVTRGQFYTLYYKDYLKVLSGKSCTQCCESDYNVSFVF